MKTFCLVLLVAIVGIQAFVTSAFLHTGPAQLFGSRHGASLALAPEDGTETADTNSIGFWDRLETILFAPLEGISEESNGSDNDEDPRLVLAEWKNTWEETVEIAYDGSNGEFKQRNVTASTMAAEESLTNFLEVWAKITLQNDKGLTTPVSPTKFQTIPSEEIIFEENCLQNSSNSSSMKLIFRPPKRYLSYKEQKSMEKNGVIPDRKGAKIDAWSPGGVEIQVTINTIIKETAIGSEANQKSSIEIKARRCNIDGDTVVKKTSERAIVRRLENAIRIWKKSNRDKHL